MVYPQAVGLKQPQLDHCYILWPTAMVCSSQVEPAQHIAAATAQEVGQPAQAQILVDYAACYGTAHDGWLWVLMVFITAQTTAQPGLLWDRQ